jgi:tRNA threonylcarbamoyladenosine biosynthesis protein TsaE
MIEACTTTSPEETISFAGTFAKKLQTGDVVALYGDLGSGKTQFVKGVCRALHADAPVTSPTFVILNRYSGKDTIGNELLIYHFDLYRVRSIPELYDLGYEEYFQGKGICLVEWAEKLEGLMPQHHYAVKLSLGAEENVRYIEISMGNET